MDIDNILVTSDLYREMEEMIPLNQYRQPFRFVAEEKVSTSNLQWADAYVGFKPVPGFEFYNIKWVHSLGAGVDGFLFNREWKEDVLLTRTICSFGQRISQYCLSYYLKDMQRHSYFHKKQLNKEWNPVTPELIDKQNILVYGTGEIGQEIARLFSSLGMKVFGVSLSGRAKPYFRDVYQVSSEHEVLQDADLVINTLPLTEKTYCLFGKEIFQSLNGAVFMNVGRGKSVIEKELLKALQQKHIRLAVLDVFTDEPLSKKSLLWQRENVIITPHISAVTTAKEAADCFLDTLDKLEKNVPIENRVDTANGY